ncbi:hypothetical protein ABZ949_05690 [Micromonospora tulbaghiae]|uniref:terminase gpP N-terminus-related DNA-binding protein n=1 Tax=Micromonospora tulbaghiae TaxID=479978 RepID=UPI0033E19DBE
MKLQDSVDRLARSLEVPKRLISLHPRRQGHAGNYAALPPAVVLGVISAFEGFVEDFLATALYLRGYDMGQIARRVSMNNPTVAEFQKKSEIDFPGIASRLAAPPPLQVWNIPSVGGRPATETIAWKEVIKRSDGWMEVRHCLTHGLASGWRSEVWPGPLRGNTTASSVLRAKPGGKHSIGLIGAISCARIYLYGAERIATEVAAELSEALTWVIPEFPLRGGDTA